jgi:hypothetical protein
LLVSTALPAYAANFHVSKGDVLGVTITGEIDPDDFEHFRMIAGPVATVGKKVIVELGSPAGNLFAALEIGEFIRANKWATLAADECDSARAAIWLA